MAGQMPNPTPEQRRPGWIVPVAAGCAVLLLCTVVALAGGAGWWLLGRGPGGQAEEPAVEYILDASPRMEMVTEGGTRLAVAQGVLAEIIRPADPTVTAGLRVFGTGAAPEACKDTDLVVPLALANQGQISDRLVSVEAGASADAALAEAMIAAIRDLASTDGPHSLVVVTGGTDACNEEAGQVIAAEADRAGIRLQMFVVGYQVTPEEADAIKGLVDEAGGEYFDADDPDQLKDILEAIQDLVDDPDTVTLADVQAAATAAAGGEAGPQNTAAPGETAVAQDTPEPGEATARPEATPAGGDATPAPPDATAAAGGDLQVGETACDHPYWPLRLGATWTYATTNGTQTWTVTEVTGDRENASATMSMTFDEFDMSVHWNCTTEGLVSYDFGALNLGGEAGSVEYEVQNEQGVWLPRADLLEPGYGWTSAYTLLMSFSGLSETYTSDMTQAFTVTGADTLDVDAGTFDTLTVNNAQSWTTSIPNGPTTSMSMVSVYSYARGVGIVQSNTTMEGGNSSSTLVSYDIPGR